MAALCAVLATALWLQYRPKPAPDELILTAVEFSGLKGWAEDDQSAALGALIKSCARVEILAEERSMGGGGIAGRVADWRPVCRQAKLVKIGDKPAARSFFERRFRPYLAGNRNGAEEEGLFTGYYEPLLHGSREREGAFQVPLYARPDDLVMLDLGRFRKDLAGRRIAGRVEAGRLVPYADRKMITGGALTGKTRVLVWVDSAVDAFFLQIQGSGRVRLKDGGELRLGFAGVNGHIYTAIGKELIRRGSLTRENVSLQTIRDWLQANPKDASGVMALNAAYVFFRNLDGDGPIGAQSVALTPGRSLAVDRRFLPLGVPIWLDAKAPSAQPGGDDRPLRRLVVAQDTGGAIRGPVRGDVFWGHGPEAEHVAGHMTHPGRYYILLPKSISDRIASDRK